MSIRVVSTSDGPVKLYAPARGIFDAVLAQSLLGGDNRLGLDTEGRGLRKKDPNVFGWGASGLRLVQFGTLDTAVVLDMLDPAQRSFAIDTLSKPYVFVAHNARHEAVSIKAALGLDISRKLYCTYLLSLLVRPGANAKGVHGLKPLTVRYLDGTLSHAEEALHVRFEELYVRAERLDPAGITHVWPDGKKVERKDRVAVYGWDNIPSDDPAYTMYAGLDAVYVRRLAPKLSEECKRVGSYGAVMREQALAQQSYRVAMPGWRIDEDFSGRLLEDYGRRHHAAKAEFLSRYGFPTGSPKKIQWARARGADIQARTKTGGLSLAGGEVDRLLTVHPDGELHHFLGLLRQASETQNVTQFVEGLRLFADPDGWVHPQFNTLHAVTGRMSAVDPAVQTVSWRNPARGCFLPDNDDEVLVSFDFSQIEPRVFAVYAEEYELGEQVKAGIDVYSAVAKVVGNRKVAKRTVLGRAYAAGIATVHAQILAQDKVFVTVDEVRRAFEIVDNTYPGFKRYARQLQNVDAVRLDSGRVVPVDPERLYKNVNSKIQGTARDLFADAALRVEALGFGGRIRLYNHDELIFSLPKAGLRETMDEIGRAMTVPFHWMPVNSEAEIYRGGRWMSEPEVVNY